MKGEFQLKAQKSVEKPMLVQKIKECDFRLLSLTNTRRGKIGKEFSLTNQSLIVFSFYGLRYIGRIIDENLKPQSVLPLKHGGGNVMEWTCFSRYDPNSIYRFNGNIS